MTHNPELSGDPAPERREKLRIQSIFVPASDDNVPRLGELDPHSLGDYQRAVGGYIEAIGLSQPRATMYINEEGKLNELPLNRPATLLLWMHNPAFRYADVVMGDALIVGPPDGEGDDTNVPEELLHILFHATQLRPEIRARGDPKWYSNNRRFADWADAYAYVLDLGQRWTSVEDVRAVSEE